MEKFCKYVDEELPICWKTFSGSQALVEFYLYYCMNSCIVFLNFALNMKLLMPMIEILES